MAFRLFGPVFNWCAAEVGRRGTESTLYGAGGVMLTLRRRSRVGQSMQQWAACLTMFVTWSIASVRALLRLLCRAGAVPPDA